MTQPVPPPSTAPSAGKGVLRSYFASLAAAVVVAVLPVAQASLGSLSWTAAGWEALAVTLLGPALTAAATFVGHHKFPPE